MPLYDFVPINDVPMDGDSLIQAVFGDDFCVVNETGQLVTTSRNQRLLEMARRIVAMCEEQGSESLADALVCLRAQADTVSQADYDYTLNGDVLGRGRDALFDSSERAGGPG